jgi:hypothetical protein
MARGRGAVVGGSRVEAEALSRLRETPVVLAHPDWIGGAPGASIAVSRPHAARCRNPLTTPPIRSSGIRFSSLAAASPRSPFASCSWRALGEEHAPTWSCRTALDAPQLHAGTASRRGRLHRPNNPQLSGRLLSRPGLGVVTLASSRVFGSDVLLSGEPRRNSSRRISRGSRGLARVTRLGGCLPYRPGW